MISYYKVIQPSSYWMFKITNKVQSAKTKIFNSNVTFVDIQRSELMKCLQEA